MAIMGLVIVDLDGTLFDTREVNYRAYSEAIRPYGYSIEYDYYCEYCNGRHYLDFLPQITTSDKDILLDIHDRKKKEYQHFLGYARLNEGLVRILNSLKSGNSIALVTTASKGNTYDILTRFDLVNLFDLILTQEDIEKPKPDPEGFVKAMKHFSAEPKDCIIFEDSEVGIQAAEKTGATVFVAKGYN